ILEEVDRPIHRLPFDGGDNLGTALRGHGDVAGVIEIAGYVYRLDAGQLAARRQPAKRRFKRFWNEPVFVGSDSDAPRSQIAQHSKKYKIGRRAGQNDVPRIEDRITNKV